MTFGCLAKEWPAGANSKTIAISPHDVTRRPNFNWFRKCIGIFFLLLQAYRDKLVHTDNVYEQPRLTEFLAARTAIESTAVCFCMSVRTTPLRLASGEEPSKKLLAADGRLRAIFLVVLQMAFDASLLAGLEHQFTKNRTVNAV